ncbi:MAG: photosystem II reaction center protein Psb28 [Snowella sp.]
MTVAIEFFEGVPEELLNVSLRQKKDTAAKVVLLTFAPLKATEIIKSFTGRFHGTLRLIDLEGNISVEPSSFKLVFGGEEGDELKRVECSFEIDQEDHWERFMRFMNRYAEAHGFGYQDKK